MPRTSTVDTRAKDAVAALERLATPKDSANLTRFGIVTADRVLGVSMAKIQGLAKRIGRDPALAAALWETGCYEARLLVAYIADPAKLTSKQMDQWCREFDNWAVVDTLCFKLFDQSPLAWKKVAQWSKRKDEFVKRAGFALLASLAGHDKKATDDQFREGLRMIEREAADDRNFVKKGVSWALRRIGTRSPALREEAVEVARRLAASADAGAKWVGRDALRDLR